MTEKRHIRVFVSSTFLDMQAERDHLVKVIFPQLRKLCEARCVIWDEVDLRWGIPSEEVAEGLALPVCLDEIDRCRPYFIGLLGERYGWVPRPVEREHLAARHPWLSDHRELSVTELEITHGVLRSQPTREQGYFYFRDPTYLDRLPEGAKRSDFGSESPAARARLDQLKGRIREAAQLGTCHLREGFRDAADLGRWVLEEFTALIDRLFPASSVPSGLANNRTIQEEYARRQAHPFVGRERLLEHLDRHVAGSGAPIVVFGESGVGKTALLSSWYLRHQQRHPQEFLFAHFVGATADSTNIARILRGLMEGLRHTYTDTFGEEDVPPNDSDVLAAFPRWLEKAARTIPRVVLVLDALDQIEDRAGAAGLAWLPTLFPANVRLIVSTVSGSALDRLRSRGWSELAVEALSGTERRQLAEAFLGRFSKRLSASDLERLAACRQCGNALFLVAMLDELRQCGEFEKLTSTMLHYLGAGDPQALYELIIDRWEKDFGQEIVWSALALIWAARRGVSEAELLDLLGHDGLPLPRAHWTPFFLALESSLVSQSGLLRFFHGNVHRAVERRLLPGDDEKRRVHAALGDYFASRWEWTERKLDELPWQRLQAQDWDRLRETIANIDAFQRLHSDPWRRWDLQNYWLAMPHSDPASAYQQSLAKWEATPRTPADLAHHLVELANFHRDRAEHAAAEHLYRRALAINDKKWGAGNLRSAIVMNNLALLLDEAGRPAEAETLLRQALPIFESHGVDDAIIATLLGNLSQIVQKLGHGNEAESAIREALARDEQALGPDHLNVARDLHNLAEVLRTSDRSEEALPLQERALQIYERRLGPTHPDVSMALNGYALLLLSLLRSQEAEPLLRRALAIATTHFGSAHPHVSLYLNNLARALRELGRNAEAEPLLQEALAIDEAIHGPEHPDVASTLINLAGLLNETGRSGPAERLLQRALSITEKRYGPDDESLVDLLCHMAMLIGPQGRLKETEELLLRLLRLMVIAEARSNGTPHPLLEATKNNYANLLLSTGRNVSEVSERLNAIRSWVAATR